MSHRTLCIALCACLLAGALIYPAAAVAAAAEQTPESCPLVVLADPGDPYFGLAQEIAAAEDALLVAAPEGAQPAGTLQKALDCRLDFLLWVAAPERLSDKTMVQFSQALQAYPSAAAGLITGSSSEAARALYQRGHAPATGSLFSANAPNPAAHIYSGVLREIDPNGEAAQPVSTWALDRYSLADALQRSSYLTFTGHGGGDYLRLDEENLFTAADVPRLDGVVVSTGSCQTVRPWREGSIALRFVDQGAAAYAGFVYSPNEGYLMGEFDGLPFRYTWPDFPIGRVIQAQNRGTLQSFAAFPFHLLLGDPRISLRSAPPYRLVDDVTQGSRRTLTYAGLPAGVIPIRIAGGAAYRFVRAAGENGSITAAAQGDLFYNSRLQMFDAGADKYLLLEHPGGALTLELREHAPLSWQAADLLLDSLDHTFLFSQQSGGDLISLAFAALLLGWVGFLAVRKRLNRRALPPALLFALGAAGLHALYWLLRLGQVTIISKVVVFSPLSLAATFLLAFGGALRYLHARGLPGRAGGLLAVTFSAWAPMVFVLAAMALFNLVFFRPEFGVSLYSYRTALTPLPAWLAAVALAGAALEMARRLSARPKGISDIDA